MNQKIAIGIVVIIALGAAGYLWYRNQTPVLPPQVQNGPVTEEPDAPSEGQIAVGIEGAWRSTDDARFTRTFADGRVTDRYEGSDESTVSGNYEVNGTNIPAQVRAAAGGLPVLAIQFPEEVLFFVVVEVNAEQLELSYVGRGNTLRFERI